MLLSITLGISLAAMALVPVIALRYSYSTTTAIESGAGLAALLAVAAFLWRYRVRATRHRGSPAAHRGILAGIILGLLWITEISVNNFIAPPLPARDVIDDCFWAVIALGMFCLATLIAWQTDSIASGIRAGAWSGLVSGLLACCMGLAVVVFGMCFILHDPLNAVEWSERGRSSHAPGIAAYFAFETFAGAFGHLTILGVGMGGVLGVAGGVLGKAIRKTGRWLCRPGIPKSA